MLAIPERVPQVLHWDFLMPQVLAVDPVMHMPATPAWIAALLPATCSAPTPAADPVISARVEIVIDPAPAQVDPLFAHQPLSRSIEYAHMRLAELPGDRWPGFRLAVERLADHALLFDLGEEDNGQFASALSAFQRSIQTLRSGRTPRPSSRRNGGGTGGTSSGTSDLLWNNPARQQAERQTKVDDARRLEKLLDSLLGLKVELAEGIYLLENYRFTLHATLDGDCVVLGRRLWGSYYQDSVINVRSKEQLAEAMAELGAVGVPGAPATDDVRRGKIIVDRGPVMEIRTGSADAQIASANEFRRDQARAKLADLTSKMQARPMDGTPSPARNHAGQRH